MQGDSALAVVDRAWRKGIRPEPPIPVSEWADRNRVLPPTSAEPGRWRTGRTPYLKAVMDALSTASPCERVVLMKGAQTGGTEAGLNWLGYIIHNAPGITMLVQPSLDMVRRNTTVRIDPLIETTPSLRELVSPARSRDAGNSLFRKSFPGGQLVMTGANSAAGLRSTPVRYLFLDEVDGYPGDADGEGDPVDLAIQRTATFRGRRRIYMVSTPTLKGHSRIEAAFLDSDQRYYHVPCLHCGDMAPITWARIRWPEGRRDQAFLVCESCGGIHYEHDKPALLAAGEWCPTAPGDGRTAGFHLSALYSPWETWAEIATEHGRVKSDPPRLQVWVNTKLGESWEDQAGDTVPADPLMARREDWGDRLPEAATVLTAGVDVQGDRLEVQVIAWGADEEAWVVEYRVLWGDPSGPRVWADLDSYLATTFAHPKSVADLPIRAACIDTGGHHTKAAYEFCRTRLARRIWAIKGRGGPAIPVWPRRPTRVRGKVPLFIVGVDAVKDALYARLRLTEPGPGAVHFPRRMDADYFRQLTAERVVTRYDRGRPIRSWQPKRDGERNEALDTFVYATAALHGLVAMGLRLNDEAAAMAMLPMRGMPVVVGTAPVACPTLAPIRSRWMG
ncbi:phage terminase large subunit family protein [Magnetospirillum sp. SS-4]|uniref:phage terminase large subunit family protein n=1 Tax=Magnetospirillum sp. SS-4 TaxID=2681465 RepID=UPI00137C455F|nr:phage terminase large subunit family protein [Magnetospirillum sp. SS-4]CAA7624180.1 Phage terminase GpA [Magnetospirillum sp. SS-4]